MRYQAALITEFLLLYLLVIITGQTLGPTLYQLTGDALPSCANHRDVVNDLRRDNEANITELKRSRQMVFSINLLYADLLNALFV